MPPLLEILVGIGLAIASVITFRRKQAPGAGRTSTAGTWSSGLPAPSDGFSPGAMRALAVLTFCLGVAAVVLGAASL